MMPRMMIWTLPIQRNRFTEQSAALRDTVRDGRLTNHLRRRLRNLARAYRMDMDEAIRLGDYIGVDYQGEGKDYSVTQTLRPNMKYHYASAVFGDKQIDEALLRWAALEKAFLGE